MMYERINSIARTLCLVSLNADVQLCPANPTEEINLSLVISGNEQQTCVLK
eukprot:m.169824 g.169824  ORF g.169824 m.169824 type:complete len:51 (+) comp53235_c0_seq8:1105-1257(+)